MVDEELYNERLEICRACPLGLETARGLICNSKLYISKEDKESISFTPRVGYVRGCSCRLESKLRLTGAHCIVGKW